MIGNIASGMLWKIGAGGAALVALVIGFFLISATIENRQITKERDKLSESITNPHTGYVARLTQARANVAQLEEALRVQNEALERQSAESKAELARLRAQLSVAQEQRRVAERRLNAFMVTAPQGSNLDERIRDVDRRIMEDLKR